MFDLVCVSPQWVAGHKAVRFNFHIGSHGGDKSPWPPFFATLTLIKNCATSRGQWRRGGGRRAKSKNVHRESHFYLCFADIVLYPSSGPHRTVGVVFRRVRPIDFPRVSSRCPRLNEVTDFQWPAAAWMTGALLANSTLNLHSNVIKRATAFETRVLSSNREERRILCVRAFGVWVSGSLRLKTPRYNYYRNRRVTYFIL